MDPLEAVSPIDGRYRNKIENLADYFSEKALNRYRLFIETEWLIYLSEKPEISHLAEFPDETKAALRQIAEEFSLSEAVLLKQIEKETKHDVKAVEYYLKEKLAGLGFSADVESVHFLCTSEDINNLSYALMLKDAFIKEILPALLSLMQKLMEMSQKYVEIAMISRTHGQPASPTTLGKEIYVFVARLLKIYDRMSSVKIFGKINGAVGNFNAHLATYPEIDWNGFTKEFVQKLGLEWNHATIQIEPHDWISELCQACVHWNCILLDLNRDMWSYIAMDDLAQLFLKGQVGSSTMPHKVNPINFENSEANAGIANAILEHLALKLPISRWQRDLSDSSAMRNLGVGFAHMLLASKNCLEGLKQIQPNFQKLEKDLDASWELLSEAIQSVMRRYGIEKPYEKLKNLTQGKKPGKETIRRFIEDSELPENEKARLLNLRPSDYIGFANSITRLPEYQTALKRLSPSIPVTE